MFPLPFTAKSKEQIGLSTVLGRAPTCSIPCKSGDLIDLSTVFDVLLREVSPAAAGLGGPPAAMSGS